MISMEKKLIYILENDTKNTKNEIKKDELKRRKQKYNKREK